MKIDPIERMNLTLSTAAAAAAFALAPTVFAASLTFGAVLEAVNLHGLRRQARRFFWGAQGGGNWTGLYGLRFVFLVVGIGGALAFGADPVGLLIGLSIVVPAVLFEAWRTRPAIDPNAPSLEAEDPAWDRWDPWLARERDESEDEAAER